MVRIQDVLLVDIIKLYDNLVQGVLEGSVKKVEAALRAGCNPHQKICNGYNLRHLAFKPEIDAMLIAHGVAPTEEKKYLYQRTYMDGGNKGWPIEKTGRNPVWRDVHGKYPENYTFEDRKKIRDRILTCRFQIPNCS